MQQKYLLVSLFLALGVVATTAAGVVYVNQKSNTAPTRQPSEDTPVSSTPSYNTTPTSTPAQAGSAVTIRGTIDCLPAKSSGGAQNLSCGIGLKGDDGNYYALDNLPQADLVSGKVIGGATVQINGTLRATPDSKLAIAGTITISSYTVLFKPTPRDDL
ncbi:hypothetical protein HY086_02320 [Candidatus Gottesmanbacteria bacterium]|nr:hypothetical protein [Candidatus Gottesmanbacteria bacterium]